MNVIMGLPRSGSTLLCNILAQNPDFQVEHTNPLPGILGAMVAVWSNSPDVKGGLIPDRREETETKLHRSAKAFCDAWNDTEKVPFCKSRGWAMNILALKQVYPDAKVIVTVRDLREVFCSFENQHRKFPLLDDNPVKGITQKAVNMFSAEGMIGSCLKGVEDILNRKQDVFFVKYEDFVRHPMEMMERLYCYIEQPSFEHDFENVVNTATDPDHLYNNKFPHNGSGKVQASPPSWPKTISDMLANSIMAGFPWFNQQFGYRMPQSQQPPQKPQSKLATGPGLAELKEMAAQAAMSE